MDELMIVDAAELVTARPFADLRNTLGKNSPEILITLGVVSMLAGTVLACRATLKAPDAVKTAREKFESIKEARAISIETPEVIDYSNQDYRQDLFATTAQTFWDFTKLYGLPVILLGGGVFSIYKGHGITVQRNEALTVALTGAMAGYKAYRDRVRAEVGTDKESDLYYNAKTETLELESADGKKKTKEKITTVAIPEHSQYAAYFDEASINWQPSPELNLTFLRCQQQYANNKLQINKVLFLNEVLEMLGLPITSAGQVVGWAITDGAEGDSYVDFGMYEGRTPQGRRFINGDEMSVLLDFNVDGVVYQKL